MHTQVHLLMAECPVTVVQRFCANITDGMRCFILFLQLPRSVAQPKMW